MNNLYQEIITSRLILTEIDTKDNQFILELVNSQGWLEFIGDRDVRCNNDALEYIQDIIRNDNLIYWVVKLFDHTSLGVITLIKREHLPFYDIGFAFLPAQQNKGYAYEASKAVLEYLINSTNLQFILATTVPSNTKSIKLIEKLGLSFDKIDHQENEELCLYKLNLDKIRIDRLIKSLI